MTTSPILFSGPMVRAILDGRKTQTRRVVKPQPTGEPRPLREWAEGLAQSADFGRAITEADIAAKAEQLRGIVFPFANANGGLSSPSCPYGQTGDQLWVRETWLPFDAHHVVRSRWAYAADCPAGSESDDIRKGYGYRWRPSIHMPRAASRITLAITDVRVERLKEISLDDIKAEGVQYDGTYWLGATHRVKGTPKCHATAGQAWQDRWDQLNAKRGYGWDANPWVWVLGFRPIVSDYRNHSGAP